MLVQQLAELVAACFSGIWIRTYEPEDALADIGRLCRDRQWGFAAWDIQQGLSACGQQADAADGVGQDPLAAITAINSLATPDGAAILVLRNFHRFLQSAEVVQAVANQVHRGKQNRTFLVILSPVVNLPPEIEKQFVVIEHDLPDREQLDALARGIATESGELPDDDALSRLLDAAAGLTRHEAESAFSLSLVRHGRLAPDSVWQLKEGMLNKSGLLSLYRGDERFDDLGGLDSLKAFCRRALRTGHHRPDIRPRGLMLLGVPGTGKSAFAKALGNECNRPTLTLDVGSLMGSLVGETESNIRQALQIADAMSPCVLFLDEVEKGLSGAASSGATDSGVSARLFGTFLTWLSDHRTDVFTIATCNDISKLPPEFSRAERFDGVFFLDLPGNEQKQAIWNMYAERFDLDPDQPKPGDTDWTGAEIRSCCRLSALLDLPLKEAARNVIPVAHTASESVGRLRNWASGRCLSSETTGVYLHGNPKTQSRRRKIPRDVSAN